MLSSPVLAILGNALFTCEARSDWLVPVPQRLICEGKEVFVEKKKLQASVVPLASLRRKGKKRTEKKKEKKEKNPQHFEKTLPIFFFLGSLCFEHGTYILSCT